MSKYSDQDYKNLEAWQKAMELVGTLHQMTGYFPKMEISNIISQMRHYAISIPSNIAEGKKCSEKKDYYTFLMAAYHSGAELEAQVALAKKSAFGRELSFIKIEKLLNEVMRLLNDMIAEANENK